MTASPPPQKSASEHFDFLESTLAPHGGLAPLIPPATSESEIEPLPWDLSCLDRNYKEEQFSMFGVGCGSGGLFALVFPGEDGAKKFLAANPSVGEPIATTFEARVVIWLKTRGGTLPPTAHFPEISIVTSGIVPVLSLPHAAPKCSVHRCGKLAEVDLRTLRLGEQADEFLVGWFTIERFGPPFIERSNGEFDLSVPYWAAFISTILKISYYKHSREFFIQFPGREGATQITPAVVLTSVARILNMSRERMPNFRVREIRLPRLRAIVEGMKSIAEVADPDESAALADFVRTRLARLPGATLASAELGAACQAFWIARGLPPCSTTVLHRELNRAIRFHWGARPSSDIIRDGKSKRGFHGLVLRSPAATESAASNPTSDLK